MDAPNRSWIPNNFRTKDYADKINESTPENNIISIPDNVKSFIIYFLKNNNFSPKEQRPARIYNFQDNQLNNRFHNDIKIPHFILNKNGKVCTIHDVVFALLLSVYKKAPDNDILKLINELEERYLVELNDNFDYRFFSKRLQKQFISKKLKNLIVIDCRNDYEFNGGHVNEAINISDKKVIDYLFIKNQILFQNEEFLTYFSSYKNKSIDLNLAVKLVTDYLKKENIRLKDQFSNCDRKYIIMKNFKVPKSRIKRRYSKANKEIDMKVQDGHINKTYIKNICSLKTLKAEENILKRKCSQKNIDTFSTTVMVFYCEFSSKRAPEMYNLLRSLDRKANGEDYPNLYYPDIYLLHKGYSNFVNNYSAYCNGEGAKYVKMISSNMKNPNMNKTTTLSSKLSSFRNMKKLLFETSNI